MFLRKSARQIILPMLTAALLITSCNVGATAAPTTDINALSTAIFETSVAQISAQSTQTAQAAPTNTLPPVNTSAPTLALPTLDTSGVPSPTLDVSALPTFTFDSTAAPSNTPFGVIDTPAAGGLPTTVFIPSITPTGVICDNLIFLYDVTIPDGSIVKGGESFTKLWAVKNTGACAWDEGYALVNVGGDAAVGVSNFLFKKSEDFVGSGQEKIIGISVNAPCAPGKYQAHWRMKSDRDYYFGTTLSMYIEVSTEKVGGCS
jgi:hypothetical protein